MPTARWLEGVEEQLATFEPVELRERVAESWARETEVRTPRSSCSSSGDQLPFHFADPIDPRIDEYVDRVRR